MSGRKNAKFSKTNNAVFQKYGKGYEHVPQDVFHRDYQPFDWANDPEVMKRDTSALDDAGQMKERTRDALGLLSTWGMDNMDMARWAKTTGYQPVTEQERREYVAYEQRLVVTQEGDPGHEEFLQEKYGTPVPSDKLDPVPTKIAANPEAILWQSFTVEQLTRQLTPKHFLRAGFASQWTELQYSLAALVGKSMTDTRWTKMFNNACLRPFTTMSLDKQYALDCFYAEGFSVFVTVVMQTVSNGRKLCNYFFIPCSGGTPT